MTSLALLRLGITMFFAVVAWMAYAFVTGDRRLGRSSLWVMGCAYALMAFALWRERRQD
jgi:hypothetical protein